MGIRKVTCSKEVLPNIPRVVHTHKPSVGEVGCVVRHELCVWSSSHEVQKVDVDA